MDLSEIAKRLGYLLYVVSPNATSFEKLEDVPDYIVQTVPLFTAFLIIEVAFNFLQKNSDCFQLDDGLTSIGQGIIQELSRLFTEGTLLAGYIYVYNNYRIVTLPWNSTETWFFAMLAVDFAYYWVHRWEINLAWSGHQVHHSSEFYNLTTAMRQSALQAYYEPVLYLPLAFVLSPSAYMVHRQFNRLFQFLIHTEAVQTLGPLELVLNTPSHHRVHHGRDRYCIDKNYGGTLIIWDRLFGTFAAEQRRPAYGLTHPVGTFDPWTLQTHHFLHVCRQFWAIEGLGNKLSTLFKGPGWQPGKPRLGDPNDIPDVRRPIEAYAPKTTLLCKIYVAVHFAIVVIGYVKLKHWSPVISTGTLLCGIIYIFLSLGAMGAFLDKRNYACALEAFRCVLMFVLDARVFHLSSMVDSVAATVFLNVVRATYAASFLGCLAASLKGVAWTVKRKGA
ncbi:hypothetical protein HPB50_014751 [Hyalomma asiaticum]|uniref:Uncharacterized protein n=1 Tax=Hyalomma asiaticum TaxID=266040 RepID=A0ACB7S7H5_HYAAI|nr:hypothetical protein HPB50_014751 [Hyalomma asiaticum]